MNNNCCNQCGKCDCDSGCGCPNPCGCPEQVLSIEQMSDNPAVLQFNLGGKSVQYDFTSLIQLTETDTSLSADTVARVLKFIAERHTDTISAAELGALLHIADIGDVDISGVQDNSIFVYQKNSDCGEGCEGIDNSWVAWNANEHLVTSLSTLMGYDADGNPKALTHPTNTNQFYQFGWNAQNKMSFSQPVEVSSAPVDSDNKVYRLYLDPTTKQLVYVKENA